MRTTVSLTDEQTEYVDANFSQGDESDAQAIRDAVERAMDLEGRVDDLEERVDELAAENEDLRTDVDRLQNEKQQILEQREEHRELVRAVERDQTLEERWRSAGLATRLRWRVFGMNDDDDE